MTAFAHANWDDFRLDIALELTDIKLVTARNLSDKEIDEAVNLATDAIDGEEFHNKPLTPKIMIQKEFEKEFSQF